MPPKRRINYRRPSSTTIALAAKMAKMNMSKKNSKTVQINRRKKPKGKTTGYGELSTRSYKYGKTPKKSVAGAWKLLQANTQRNVNGFEFCNRYMANPSQAGYCVTNFCFSGSNMSGSHGQPLQLHSLSATPQIVSGTVTNPTAQWCLRRNDVTTSSYVTFANYGNYTVQNASGPSNFAQSFAGQADILRAVSIKLCLYGSITRPVKYLIQLVQLKKPYLHPDYINSVVANAGNPAAIPEMGKATAFYDELTKQYIYNPITWSDTTQYRDLKVMKSWVQVIQPALTTERTQIESETSGAVNQQMPHSKIMNIYYKFNRRQNYNWDDQVQSGVSTGNTADVVPVIAGANKLDVTYNARIYLMIRALCPVPTFNNNFDAAAQPSYDISIRQYHENQG